MLIKLFESEIDFVRAFSLAKRTFLACIWLESMLGLQIGQILTWFKHELDLRLKKFYKNCLLLSVMSMVRAHLVILSRVLQ